MDLRTLQFWHKLEHFYPYILQEQKSPYIKTFWINGEPSFPRFEAFLADDGKEVRGYCVYLGIFQVAPALVALEEGVGKKMRFRDCGKDESCFCMFRLTPDGNVQPESFRYPPFRGQSTGFATERSGSTIGTRISFSFKKMRFPGWRSEKHLLTITSSANFEIALPAR